MKTQRPQNAFRDRAPVEPVSRECSDEVFSGWWFPTFEALGIIAWYWIVYGLLSFLP